MLKRPERSAGKPRVLATSALIALGLWLALGTARAQPSESGASQAPPPPSAPPPANAGSPQPAPGPGSAPAQPSAAGAPPAHATPPVPMRPLADAIEANAGATCLDREMLVRRIARWLERDSVDARIRVEVRGDARDPAAVAFVIHVGEGHRSERSIHDAPADCDQFHSALALSIALAIDAALMDAERAQAEREELPSDEQLFEKPEPAYFRFAFGALGHATSGLLTDVALGASARFELGFVPWLDFRLGAFGSSVSNQRVPGISGQFAADLLAGRLDACVSHDLRQLRPMLCVGGMGGVFRTRGDNYSRRSDTQSEPWLALAGGFELQAEVASWLALAVAVDAVVPLAQRRIVVDGPNGTPIPDRDRDVSPLGVLVGAGPIFRFF